MPGPLSGALQGSRGRVRGKWALAGAGGVLAVVGRMLAVGRDLAGDGRGVLQCLSARWHQLASHDPCRVRPCGITHPQLAAREKYNSWLILSREKQQLAALPEESGQWLIGRRPLVQMACCWRP